MTTFLEILTALAILGLALWFLRRLLRPKDPFSFVLVPRGMRPKGRSGAVALEEPGEDNPDDAFPARQL